MWYVYKYTHTHTNTHTHTHTQEYYSAIKKNEILPFVRIWMEVEYNIQSKSEKDKTISFHSYAEFRKQNK